MVEGALGLDFPFYQTLFFVQEGMLYIISCFFILDGVRRGSNYPRPRTFGRVVELGIVACADAEKAVFYAP